MKNTPVKLPANCSMLTKEELRNTVGGSAAVEALQDSARLLQDGFLTGARFLGTLAGYGGNFVANLCAAFVYLAGNVVASIIWAIA